MLTLLESPEVQELELLEEQALCEKLGIEFLSFPISDRSVPSSLREAKTLVAGLVAKVQSGVGVGVHCRAGIGRSGLVAGCVLLQLGVSYRFSCRK